ncbi:MAG: hypothetical protein ACOC5T_05905, partial [Elusimicrobiota bacterium]
IGGGHNLSVNYVVNKIIKKIGVNISIKKMPPVTEPMHTLADITLAEDLLKWVPEHDFGDIIDKIIQSVRDSYQL